MNIHQTTLSNGLPLITVPIEGTEAVTALVLVGAGSMHDPAERAGLAHFLEHMMFKGTDKYPSKRALSEALDSVGAEYNAFTHQEFTGYYVKAAAEHFSYGTDILGQMVLHSQLPAEEIMKEQDVIVEELRMYRDTPQRHVVRMFYETLLPNHPIGRDIAGSEETVRSITRDDVVAFWEEYYRAVRSVCVVVGAVGEQEAQEQMETAFQGLQEGGSALKADEPPEQQEAPRIAFEQRETDQAHFWCGARSYTLTDERRYAARLLSTILGGNMSSRLFQKIREEEGLAYYVWTVNDNGFHHGILASKAGVERDSVREATTAIIDVYRDIKENGVTAEELNRAKEYVKGSSALRLEESNEMALFAGTQQLFRDDILTLEEIFARIESVTREDIRAVANDLLQPHRLNMALIAPEANEEALHDILATV